MDKDEGSENKNHGELDLDQARKSMAESLFYLERALFAQAAPEYERVLQLRSLVAELEADLFRPETISRLTDDEKVRLYKIVDGARAQGLEMLQKLHESVPSAMQALDLVHKLKSSPSRSQVGPSPEIEKVKALILEKIKSEAKRKLLVSKAAVRIEGE